MNLRRNICISFHLGCGDALICNGLIRHYAKLYDLVVVMAKPNNFETVAYMLRDLGNVVVRYVVDDEGASVFRDQVWKGEKLVLGNGGEGGFVGARFDQEFYRQANLSFQLRWDYFHFVREPSQEINLNMFSCEPEYAFVHQDKDRGFRIADLQIRAQNQGFKLPEIVEPDRNVSRNLFAWLPAILNASQIHCINSSFALLVDSLPRIEGQQLFLHAYARKGETPTFRHDWQVLK